MIRITIAVLALGAVFVAALAGGVYARRWQENRRAESTPTIPSSPQRGALLFQMHCAKCHGPEGRGDAEGTEQLTPAPRDFARRPWKFEPTKASIERVVTEGIPGTSMPAYGQSLSQGDLAALVEHVLRLSEPANADPFNDPFAAAGFSRVKTTRPAPTLQLTDAAGKAFSLADVRGKVVLLHFWGETCPHCLERMPKLARLQSRFSASDLAVVNVCTDANDAPSAQALLTRAEPSLVTYVDDTGLASARYEVSLMPTIWLLDRHGNLLAKSQGARDWSDPRLQALLEELTDGR